MELTIKFDRAILMDQCTDLSQMQENEVIIGQVNGKRAILMYLSDEQWDDIKRQAKQELLAKKTNI
jgi:hypothetical protein